jgi:hypothetical protein
MVVALALGLAGCGEDTPKSDGAHLAFGKIKTGSKDATKDPEPKPEAGSTSGDGQGESTGPAPPEVDAVAICGSPETTVTKTDADKGRYGPGDTLGCANGTAPSAGVAGMAAFNLEEAATQRLRDAGDDEHCCYSISRPMRGRPLVTGDRMWCPDFFFAPALADAGLATPVARRVAAAWLHDARLEWASVASFQRAAAELSRLGAPAELRAAYARAADDERRHTDLCLRLAERALGRRLELGPLPAAAPRDGDLADVLRRTFDEGCVAETAAALIAARSARGAAPPARAALLQIARDETDHAALAWTTVGWALRHVDARAAADFLAWTASRGPTPAAPGADPDAAHGRLGLATQRAIAHDAWARCTAPLLDRLAADLALASARPQFGPYSSFSGSKPRSHGSYPAGGVS